MDAFDPLRLLRELHEHDVEFVLIGGMAGRVHGSTTFTNDLDICYRRTKPNCERLAAMLNAVDARLRDLPVDLAAPVDASTLWQGENFTFVTMAGFFDCLASPQEGSATSYTDLAQRAERITIAGAPTLVCSLEDLIRMKEAAGRAKDLIEVEVLKAVLKTRG